MYQMLAILFYLILFYFLTQRCQLLTQDDSKVKKVMQFVQGYSINR